MSLEFFQRKGEKFTRCNYTGSIDLPHAQEMVKELFQYCKKHGVKKVLFDCSRATGDLSLLDRYQLGQAAAAHLGNTLKIAFFGTEDQVQPDRFMAKVAQQKGANVWGFNNIFDAEKWLESGG